MAGWRRQRSAEFDFAFPTSLAQRHSELTDAQAAHQVMDLLSMASETMGSNVPESLKTEVVKQYTSGNEAITGRHAGSGAERIKKNLLEYLESVGGPAKITAYSSGDSERTVSVRMEVNDAPDKILGLAEMLRDAGHLREDISLSEMKKEKKAHTSPVPLEDFLKRLNQAKPGASAESNAGREIMAKTWYIVQLLKKAVPETQLFNKSQNDKSNPRPGAGDDEASQAWQMRGNGENYSPEKRIRRQMDVVWQNPESRAKLLAVYDAYQNEAGMSAFEKENEALDLARQLFQGRSAPSGQRLK